MITIFSCPKPFRGHTDIIQRNAIMSWRLLDPSIEIVLFGEEEGTAEVAQIMAAKHIPTVETTEYGTPLISDIFDQINNVARNEYLCYVNSDIIFLKDCLLTFLQIQERREKFLIVGQRLDFEQNTGIDFSEDWEIKFAKQVKKREFFIQRKELIILFLKKEKSKICPHLLLEDPDGITG